MGIAPWITVCASLISGLIGALLTALLVERREKRRFRVETLRRFAANRYDLKGDEFTRALNEVFVVFNDAPDVMHCLGEFHRAVTGKQAGSATDDALIQLFKAMCRRAKIRYEHFNDSFFATPFNTRPSSMSSMTGEK